MSQENIEVVRKAIETFDSDVDAWLTTLDPEIDWYVSEDRHSVSHGHEAVLGARQRWLETWVRDSYRYEIEELRGQGDDVMAVVCVTARGRASGIEIEDRTYAHWRVRDGKIVYVYEHETRDEALEAAGLRE